MVLNKPLLSKKASFKALAIVLLASSLTGSGCGKRKPPLPPVERVVQRVEVNGTQRGSLITLAWTLPDRNASGSSTLNISRVDIYRLAEPLTTPLTLSEEEFASRSTLISSVPVSDADFARRQMTYNDALEFSGQSARLRYAIRFVNASGQKASFSNFLLIEPTAQVADQPNALTAEILEEAIVLQWIAPSENVDGSKPANILGYNIYRANADQPSKIINDAPVTNIMFRDEFFVFGQDYRYFVRTVSLGGDGKPLESIESNAVAVKPSDTFAPSPPSAVTIAAAPNNLSIFFAVNPEKDIAGYRVYRSSRRDQPLAEWNLLTENLLTTNTFQDKNIEPGATYFYYLTAVDKNGNVSGASVIVSETAP